MGYEEDAGLQREAVPPIRVAEKPYRRAIEHRAERGSGNFGVANRNPSIEPHLDPHVTDRILVPRDERPRALFLEATDREPDPGMNPLVGQNMGRPSPSERALEGRLGTEDEGTREVRGTHRVSEVGEEPVAPGEISEVGPQGALAERVSHGGKSEIERGWVGAGLELGTDPVGE
jgi:hypothetical protein